MPRNSSGTMTLPAPGVPFQSGQVISSAQVNATFADVATEISDSASRSGKGGFSAPVRVPDGTAAVPAYAFGGEINSGFYRAGANDVRLTVGGVDALKLVSGGVSGPLTFPNVSTAFIASTGANGSLFLQGNRNAADPAADVLIGSTATRTAGLIADFHNPINAVSKLQVDYQGLLRLTAQAAAIQPASIWTAITPDAGVTATRGLGFTKDAVGKVHLRGMITNNTGGNISAINNTNPLPVGFRPASQRDFICSFGNSAVGISVSTGGVLQFPVVYPANASVVVDGISFFAEA